jgi:hypothetical protein
MSRLLFTTLTPPVFTLPDFQVLTLPLSGSTLVRWSSDRSLTHTGIHTIGGNVGGMLLVISILNINNNFALTLAHEHPSADPADRIWTRNKSIQVSSPTIGAFTLVYDQDVQRWIHAGIL